MKSIIDTALERLRLRKEERERENDHGDGKKMRKEGESDVGGDEKKDDEEEDEKMNDTQNVENKEIHDVKMAEKQDKYTSPMEGKKSK